MKKVIVISGVTASGKTRLSEIIHEKSKSESVIINADSMQMYLDLPILSAQPVIKAHHKLFSVLNYYENASAGKWLAMTKKFIDEAHKKNQFAIVVGGTGFYIKMLLEGAHELPDIDEDNKKKVREEFLEKGKEKFHADLIKQDESLKKIHVNDIYRAQRAKEIILQTGKSFSHFENKKSDYDFTHYCILPKREVVYQRCDERFLEMIKNEVICEVKQLHEKTKDSKTDNNHSVFKTLGYLNLVKHIKGEIKLEEAIAQAQKLTRNYAKRQYTWFNNQFKDKIILDNTDDTGDFLN